MPLYQNTAALEDQHPKPPSAFNRYECDICGSVGGKNEPQEPRGKPLCEPCERDNEWLRVDLEARDAESRHIDDCIHAGVLR